MVCRSKVGLFVKFLFLGNKSVGPGQVYFAEQRKRGRVIILNRAALPNRERGRDFQLISFFRRVSGGSKFWVYRTVGSKETNTPRYLKPVVQI